MVALLSSGLQQSKSDTNRRIMVFAQLLFVPVHMAEARITNPNEMHCADKMA